MDDISVRSSNAFPSALAFLKDEPNQQRLAPQNQQGQWISSSDSLDGGLNAFPTSQNGASLADVAAFDRQHQEVGMLTALEELLEMAQSLSGKGGDLTGQATPSADKSGDTMTASDRDLLQNLEKDASLGGDIDESQLGNLSNLPPALQAVAQGLIEKSVQKKVQQALRNGNLDELLSLAQKIPNMPAGMQSNMQTTIENALNKAVASMGPNALMSLAEKVKDLPPAMQDKVMDAITHALEKKMEKLSPNAIMDLAKRLNSIPQSMRAKLENVILQGLEKALAKSPAGPEQLMSMLSQTKELAPGMRNKVEKLLTNMLEKMVQNMPFKQLMSIANKMGSLPDSVKSKIEPTVINSLNKQVQAMSVKQRHAVAGQLSSLPSEISNGLQKNLKGLDLVQGSAAQKASASQGLQHGQAGDAQSVSDLAERV